MKQYLFRFTIPLLLLLLMPAVPVSANAAPPPPHLWLHIAYEIQPAPTLIGMQLAACTNTECNTPRLLHQYGSCTVDGCLPAGDNAPIGRFDCAADRCLVVATDYSLWQAEPLLLIAQFDNQTYVSAPFTITSQFGETFRVTVRSADLTVAPMPYTGGAVNSMTGNGLVAFFLTLLLELLVALAFVAITRTPRREWPAILGAMAFVNLLTVPVVWLFFPSLGVFQPDAARAFGWIILAGACFYGAAAVGLTRVQQKWRIGLAIASLISVPCVYGMALVVGFTLSYGRYLPTQVAGLPPALTVALSQIFAFGFETLILWGLLRGRLTIRQIVPITLLANVVSFTTGWFLLPIIG